VVASLVSGGQPHSPIHAFSIDRFADSAGR